MPCSEKVSTKLRRIAELAEGAPDMAFTSLNHHIDLDWLKEAYRRTRKDGATGIDGRTAEEYAVDLEENLQSLLKRAKSGTYRAPPVRRVHIPKGGNRGTRPLGIPTFEDKVLQRAVTMILEVVYEPLFKDFSYAFRPNRSPHQALDRLWEEGMATKGGWLLEMDIQSYFDAIPHDQLREILRKRVRDGVLLRLIGKWLKAGIWEEGRVSRPGSGSPQGGVISPILSNIFLHEVLDCWFEEEVKPRMNCRAYMIRFADDAVLGFASEKDAKRVQEVLPKRFSRYGLTLHPEKTRLVQFQRPPLDKGSGGGEGRPGTFDFLGFTHYWGRSRGGNNVIQRKTAKSRFSRTLMAIKDFCRKARNLPLTEQHHTLSLKLRGHFSYFGITGNIRALSRLRNEVIRMWFKWINRRSQKKSMTWKKFGGLERFRLPRAWIVHGYGT